MHVRRTLQALEDFVGMMFRFGEEERQRIHKSVTVLVGELEHFNRIYHDSSPQISENLGDLLYHCRHIAGHANDGIAQKIHLSHALEIIRSLRSPLCFDRET